ncbi:MAG: branched-chain amino acid ABC transporter permease [Alphaproteobacteria bacterium]|nr:branched-chain amino acid ABC transporter permease [Alphaproteobacteria bacterium]
MTLAYIVISIGQMIVLGFAGQFAFANAAFMGIGAYTAALLTSRLGVSFWLALPTAGVLCAALGAIVGLPSLRISRVYLSIVTLAFGEMVTWVFLYWTSVTRGTNGAKLTRPVTFGIDFRSDTAIFFVVLIVTALLAVAAKRLLESRYGRAFVAIRENELVARCNGINVPLYKTIAFVCTRIHCALRIWHVATRPALRDRHGWRSRLPVGRHHRRDLADGLARGAARPPRRAGAYLRCASDAVHRVHAARHRWSPYRPPRLAARNPGAWLAPGNWPWWRHDRAGGQGKRRRR